MKIRQAAVGAVRELAMPLGTATGTTLAAFIPMLMAKGGTADFHPRDPDRDHAYLDDQLRFRGAGDAGAGGILSAPPGGLARGSYRALGASRLDRGCALAGMGAGWRRGLAAFDSRGPPVGSISSSFPPPTAA